MQIIKIIDSETGEVRTYESGHNHVLVFSHPEDPSKSAYCSNLHSDSPGALLSMTAALLLSSAQKMGIEFKELLSILSNICESTAREMTHDEFRQPVEEILKKFGRGEKKVKIVPIGYGDSEAQEIAEELTAFVETKLAEGEDLDKIISFLKATPKGDVQ
jgi:hypothetical protein